MSRGGLTPALTALAYRLQIGKNQRCESASQPYSIMTGVALRSKVTWDADAAALKSDAG